MLGLHGGRWSNVKTGLKETGVKLKILTEPFKSSHPMIPHCLPPPPRLCLDLYNEHRHRFYISSLHLTQNSHLPFMLIHSRISMSYYPQEPWGLKNISIWFFKLLFHYLLIKLSSSSQKCKVMGPANGSHTYHTILWSTKKKSWTYNK